MNILLIAPASGPWRGVGRARWFNGRTFRFSLMSLLTVAAETPPAAHVRIVDEQVDDVPWNAGGDLVGITCMTAAAPVTHEFYRPRRIARRLARAARHVRRWRHLPYAAALGGAYYGRVRRWGIRGEDPASATGSRGEGVRRPPAGYADRCRRSER